MRLEVINQDPHFVAGKTIMGNEIPNRPCQVVRHCNKYWPKQRLAVLRSCLNILLPPGTPRGPGSVWHSLNVGTPAPVESVFHGPTDLEPSCVLGSAQKWPKVILHRYIWWFLFFLFVYFLFYWGIIDKSCTYLRCARGWFDTHCEMITTVTLRDTFVTSQGYHFEWSENAQDLPS